jgi:hypothetical protein
MWFAIGLLTFCGTVSFSIRWRLANRWCGKSSNLQDQPYEYEIRSNKGRLQGIRLSIACATSIEFCLKPETWFDRLFKFLGLSKEQQLDRLHFDEKIYVISDDQRLTSALKHNPDLPQKLQILLDAHRWPSFRVRKLWCQRGRLWVEVKPRGKQDNWSTLIIEIAEQTVPLLKACAEVLRQKLPFDGNTGKDFFIFKAAVLVGISTALVVHAGVHLLRMSMTHFPIVLDNNALWKHAMVVGGVAWVALLLLCIVWLGRTSRAHLVLLELFFVGSIGAVGSAYVQLHDFNIDWDHSTVQLQSSTIENQYTTRCGKRNSRTCYYLTLAPLADQPEPLHLQVNPTTYKSLNLGDPAKVPVHQGALRVPWIEEPQPSLRSSW